MGPSVLWYSLYLYIPSHPILITLYILCLFSLRILHLCLISQFLVTCSIPESKRVTFTYTRGVRLTLFDQGMFSKQRADKQRNVTKYAKAEQGLVC